MINGMRGSSGKPLVKVAQMVVSPKPHRGKSTADALAQFGARHNRRRGMSN